MDIKNEYLKTLKEELKEWQQYYENDKQQCEFALSFDLEMIEFLKNRIKTLEERK